MNTKPSLLFCSLLGAAVTQAGAAGATPAASTQKPNVIFIAFDDLNDWILEPGARGIWTPNFQRLMDRGVTFANAHCASPVCHPSRVSVMTGVRPSTSGIDHNVYKHTSPSWRTGPDSGTGALENAVILSQHFRDNGYRAIGCGKIFHGLQWVDGSENDPAAWDDYFPDAASQIPFQPRPEGLPDDEDSGIIGKRPLSGKAPSNTTEEGRIGQAFGAAPLQIPDAEMADFKVVDWAAAQLRKPAGAKPLFMAVGIFRPHMPWEVPQKYFDLYPLAQIQRPRVLENDLADTHGHNRKNWHQWVLANEPKFQMWERLIQGYQASITFADAQLGRLLDAIDASPGAANTVIVAWSDHGMHFGEKQNWEKFTLWERSTRVPVIISVPGKKSAGSRVGTPANLIDIYPTLCELSRIPIPAQCEGESLAPQIANPPAPRAQPSITTHTQGLQSGHSVRDDRWRYIRYFDGFEELYDHATDPDEFHNLAADPEYAGEKQRLLGWLSKIKAPLDGRYYRADGAPVVNPGEQQGARSPKKKKPAQAAGAP